MRVCCKSMARSFFGILLLMAVSMTISGCGAKQRSNADPSADEALESANHLARSAFDKGMYKQAAGIYQKVLGMAYVRNDAAVILDTRYNLALCLMELERYPEAMRLVKQVQDEASIGDDKMPPDLLLLEATIFYRDNRLDDSWAATEEILAVNPSSSTTLQAKTYFLRGLISSDRNDAAGIGEAVRNLGPAEVEMVKSDRMELQGRLAMAEKRWEQAIIDLDQATRLRREYRDYRRMAITLALSAAASEKAGRTEDAAGRYLQAGRSAAFRDDRSSARKWLIQAARLFNQVGNDALTAEADALLLQLGDTSDSSSLPN